MQVLDTDFHTELIVDLVQSGNAQRRPGAPSFVYINSRHHGQFTQPLQGWMGHKTPFEFDPSFIPAEGIGQFMTGTPPILSLMALDAALDVFADVDVKQLREKSMALTEYFLKLL